MKLVIFKNKIHKKYKKFGTVYCKAINENISFNNRGWTHISFDGKGHRRKNKNIIMRLNLVLYAHEVIRRANKVIKDEMKERLVKGVKRKIRNVEIACDIKGTKKHITVILRKIGDGNFHYYSVRRTKNKIINMLSKQKSP